MSFRSCVHILCMSMKAQEVATVCALVLLFRLSGVPCPPPFLCLLPLWRVNPFSLDQYIDGLTCVFSDPILAFVHETVLDSDRCWVNWDQVLETRLSLFTLWCNVWLRFSLSKKQKLTPFLLVLSRRLLRSSMSDAPLRSSRLRASSRSRSRSSRRAFVTPPRRHQILVDTCFFSGGLFAHLGAVFVMSLGVRLFLHDVIARMLLGLSTCQPCEELDSGFLAFLSISG